MEDEVVISGIGGRFPECDSFAEYRAKLLENIHLISDENGVLLPKHDGVHKVEAVPFNDKNLKSGKIRHGDKFDNTFFGMHTRLAAATDAICRNVLERTLEALLDAGYSPKDIHGTNTAVFMGYHCSESESNFIRESADGFGIMGLNAAMTANRVSYWLDARGTSFTHNTGLISGVEGLDMARAALTSGEFDRAVVGSATLSYLAELAVHYDDLGWLSPTGTCKPFDIDADGGVRSEAVVVMLLERRHLAKRVYASLVHTKVGICAQYSQAELPRIERPAMTDMLERFYRESGIHPDDIEYLEADGWGVPAIDEAEINSLDDAIASRRSNPLLIGSVKGNIGQVEAASGLAAVCKVLIAMETGTIPATVNHVESNFRMPALHSGRIRVLTENVPYEGGLMAVNNLGLGGMLGHVVLRPNPRVRPPVRLPVPQLDMPRLLLLSGRTPEGLEEVVKLAEKNATDDQGYVNLMYDAFSKHIFGHMYRAYAIVPKEEDKPATVQFYTGQKRPIWFVYSGMGSQWPTMGADLMRIPVFAEAVERCHQALLPLGIDLKHIITTPDPAIYDNILHSFVGIAAVQVGLTDVLRAVGIEPVGIIGHSVGELGCAYADGCITAEQMVLAAHARGQASNETELIPGMMAAVGLGYQDVKSMVPETIEVACHNSSSSCTLSGPTADMNEFVAHLKNQGIFARAVNVSNIAYHSRYIKPAAPRLLELLQDVIHEPKARSDRWISTSVQEKDWASPLAQTASAEFFTNNLLSSVYFEEGSAKIPSDALVIEIAPHGLLQAILKRSLHADVINVPLTKRDCPSTLMVLDALGKIYLAGIIPQIKNLYPAANFPVVRGTNALSDLATWDHRDTWPVAFLKAPADSGPRTELHLPLALSTEELSHLSSCSLNGHPTLSPATCINLVISVMSSYNAEDTPIVFTNVTFHETIPVPPEGSSEMYVYTQRGTGRFEVSVAGVMVATGLALGLPGTESSEEHVPEEDRVTVDGEYVYEELGRRGMVCRDDFRCIKQLRVGAAGWTGTAVAHPDLGLQLEAILQVVALQHSEDEHQLHRPRMIRKIVYHPLKGVTEPVESPLLYHSARQRFTFGALEVVQVKTSAESLAPTSRPILVHSQIWVPYDRSHPKDLSHLASLSLQVAALQARPPLPVTALAQDTDPSPLRDAVVQAAEQQLPDLYVELQHGGEKGEHCALLVSEASCLGEALALQKRNQGLLLAELPPGCALPAEVTQLISYTQGGRQFALLKQSVAVDPNSEVLQLVDDDVSEERLQLSQTAVVYVVSRCTALRQVLSVTRNIATKPGGARACFVFIQDAGAPPFSPTISPYAEQLRLGLRVNVLQGGKWGGVHRIHLASMSASVSSDLVPLHRSRMISAMEGGLRVQALGINPYNEDDEHGKGAVGLLDYSALRPEDGSRVMGLCKSSAAPLQPDAVLSWPVPAGWSDEDAASVPLMYSTAMYAVRELLRVKPADIVLVLGGDTALGQAAIPLLFSLGCKVVTTAANEAERDMLRAAFPSLSADDIVLDRRGADCLCTDLRSRKGSYLCVNKVLCQGDYSFLQNSIFLLNGGGRMVHVGTDHNSISHSVGLSAFIKSVSFYSVAWNWPLYARNEVKGRVRDWISVYIKRGLVKPLTHQTLPPNGLSDAQRRVMQTAEKVVLDMKAQAQQAAQAAQAQPTQLDPGKACLVLGSSAARAVSVVEWLLSSGARDVSVTLVGRPVGSWLSRRLHLLSTHYGATVRALSASAASEPQQLVKAAAQSAPLGLVLVLPLESVEQHMARVRSLDSLTRSPGCTLAVLAAAGVREVVELGNLVRCRREQGFPAVLASMGDLPADVRMMPFHQVLRAANNPTIDASNVDVLQLLPKEEICVTEDGSAALPNLLPNSVEALRRLGLSLTEGNNPRILPSLIGGAPGRRNREVPPVFLVGGISDSPARELEPIARKLMTTAVVLSPPAGARSVEHAAESLLPMVVSMLPEGPYTLAGRGWGGCVALETARLLEARGFYVSVFLLDASPDALCSAVRLLSANLNGIETALLKFLLNLDKEREERVHRAQTWSARVEAALGSSDAVLEAALNCVLLRVQSLLAYRPCAPGSKLHVTLLSTHSYHLQSNILSEVCSGLRSLPLHGVESLSECATLISSGVHVGRGSMLERRALASLFVDF